jgi:predicted nucleic acid-binding protein
MIVVDASVAVKWFFPEPGADEAQQLLQGPEKLIAPALIRLEVLAAITRKVRLQELPIEDARTACDLWSRALATGALTLTPDQRHLPRAIELAFDIRHPLQDCLYLAVAEYNTGTLVTADPKFAERAARSYAAVRLLSYRPPLGNNIGD